MQTNQVEEIKNKLDIVSVISEYIEVKKAGRNYKANCPFHGEKTPSFMITPELQIYKCFGCNRSGDIFTFIEEHEGMEFKEALKYLADKAGVTLTSFKGEEVSEREKIIEINKSALNFYNYALNGHALGKKVLEYLTKDRGLTIEIIKEFKLGYSPENYDALSKYLVGKKKINAGELTKAGLLVGRGTDRFRGRVIFPLSDHRGNIIGFAGRILPWAKQDMAKYINSPDTPAYHKSKVLYGMDLTKSYIRDKKYAVIVEGELDMISSYQAGIRNVIAIKGSALTEDQLRLISRFAQKIVLCLDSDFAGNEAARRGSILAVNMGFEVNVASLGEFKDPDEIARKNPEMYSKAIDEAINIWDFLINLTFNKYDSGTGSGKSSISKEVIPTLHEIKDKIVQSFYVEKVARRLSVPVEAVISELNRGVASKDIHGNTNTTEFQKQEKSRRRLLEEKLLINSILKDPKDLFVKEVESLFQSPILLKALSELKKYLEEGKKFELYEFESILPSELKENFSEIVLENSEAEEVSVIIKELTTLDLKQQLESLGDKIKNSEDNEELLKEFSKLSKKLSTL